MGTVSLANQPEGFRQACRKDTVIDVTDWEPVTPGASDEELNERAQSLKWHTSEEVIARLKSLE